MGESGLERDARAAAAERGDEPAPGGDGGVAGDRLSDPPTVEDFRRLYPWPEHLPGRRDRALEWVWWTDVEAEPESVWSLLRDTSRVANDLGLAAISFEESSGVLYGARRVGGLRHEWVEHPWQWAHGVAISHVRAYSRGLARIERTIYLVEAQPRSSGARICVYYAVIPRGALARAALRVFIPSLGQKFRRTFARIGAEALAGRSVLSAASEAGVSDRAAARMNTLARDLAEEGFDAALVDTLCRHIRDGDPLDLDRIQPRLLASEWGVVEDEAIRLFLHATRVGLCDMTWDVICPHCRGVRAESDTLGDVPREGNCGVCEIEFRTDHQNAIEITFHVHRSIRDIPKRVYCSGEANVKSHIRVQQALAPGERREVATRLPSGQYQARLRGSHDIRPVAADSGGEARWTWSASDPPEQAARIATGATLVLVNDSDVPHMFILEEVSWTEHALRPEHLFSLQAFRDLFSEEYLATDVQLSVGEQTILFTDIVGSTRFYASRGDPDAFAEVKRHFEEISEEVRHAGGALVKTIGDAAMAAFSDPVRALEAADKIMARFPPDRADTSIRLRASLNTGPCIAVNLNRGIDYFGNTVNVAAKLQACAEGSQIAFSRAMQVAPGVSAFLEERGARVVEIAYESKSLGKTIPVYRWDTTAAAEEREHASGRAAAAEERERTSND